jgi:hypothetical protein
MHGVSVNTASIAPILDLRFWVADSGSPILDYAARLHGSRKNGTVYQALIRWVASGGPVMCYQGTDTDTLIRE